MVCSSHWASGGGRMRALENWTWRFLPVEWESPQMMLRFPVSLMISECACFELPKYGAPEIFDSACPNAGCSTHTMPVFSFIHAAASLSRKSWTHTVSDSYWMVFSTSRQAG